MYKLKVVRTLSIKKSKLQPRVLLTVKLIKSTFNSKTNCMCVCGA
jgi:hypothetical protein